MAKRKYQLNKKTILKRYNEGRGRGKGSKYKPWITIYDYPSKGRISRVKGIKTQRIHHFLSDIEKSFFFLCEWDDRIIDIQEKFPLNRLKTLEICEEANISHPISEEDEEPLVLTTDFLLTYYSKELQEEYQQAFSIQPSSSLKSLKAIELLEIQRRYWESKDIPFFIFTEKQINKVVVSNITFALSGYEIITEDNFNDFDEKIDILLKGIQIYTGSLQQLLESLDNEFVLDNGSFLQIFKSLLAHKTIRFDMTRPFDIRNYCSDFTVILKERGVSNL